MIWGSIVFYFGFTFIFYSDLFGYSYMGTARNVMATANFWFTLILTVTVLLVPVVAERFYYIDTRPTLTDKVRLKQKISKSRTKSGELILRRASTMRRSTRSLNRSGYAFAHQEGFGSLITSGTNMRMGGGRGRGGATVNGGAAGRGGGAPPKQRTTGGNRQNGGPRAATPPPPVAQPHIQHGNSNNNSSQKHQQEQQGQPPRPELPNVVVEQAAEKPGVELRPGGQVESTEL